MLGCRQGLVSGDQHLNTYELGARAPRRRSAGWGAGRLSPIALSMCVSSRVNTTCPTGEQTFRCGSHLAAKLLAPLSVGTLRRLSQFHIYDMPLCVEGAKEPSLGGFGQTRGELRISTSHSTTILNMILKAIKNRLPVTPTGGMTGTYSVLGMSNALIVGRLKGGTRTCLTSPYVQAPTHVGLMVPLQVDLNLKTSFHEPGKKPKLTIYNPPNFLRGSDRNHHMHASFEQCPTPNVMIIV